MTENGCDVCEMIDGGDGRPLSLKTTTKSHFRTRSLYPNLNLILKKRNLSPSPNPSLSSQHPAAGP